MRLSWKTILVVALTLLVARSAPLLAQTGAAAPPNPTPDPNMPNVFYGATLPGSANQPVLVFVHGLHGTAMDWWGTNDMYALAYAARYRTAFISMNADNTPNDGDIQQNAAMLRSVLPNISAHFNGDQMYMIGHSKGGVDIQGAMLFPEIPKLIKGVITISTPNQGTELADWAFGPGLAIASQFNLLTPGVFSLQTANMATFRSNADPILKATGIPFYTMTGDIFTGNPITDVTGLILNQLVPGQRNDGFVTVPRSQLPPDYSTYLGTFNDNHFLTDNGDVSFSRISATIGGLENTLSEFQQAANNGFGDPANTWIWSMKWYKGQLYVGTGREVHCMSLATSQATQGTKFYDLGVLTGDCPDFGTLETELAAEIWRYSPETKIWQRVFKSPSTIPMGQDANGNPILIGRDIGFRGMEIYTEPDGTQALYVGGASAGEVFRVFPPYDTIGFPPPRILRTTDGENWAPLPQDPGTFMGEIAKPRPGSTRFQWSFRALTSYNGMLFATVGDYRGVGMIVASANPSAGNDAWFAASPIPEDFPVWNLTTFNNFLYATTGDLSLPNNPGTGVWKTDATGAPPYQFTPIIQNGGDQTIDAVRSPDGLSFMAFKGQLYVGTNRPTELYRINPDDTWDLIVGEARNTSTGFKAPLSGFGLGFGSWFNGHFWRMGTLNDTLFLSTWDWSIQLRGVPAFDHMFDDQYGFDLLRTDDGIHWTAVTRNGLGDPNNYGGRSIETTPFGLFLGTARLSGGGQVFQCQNVTCTDAPQPIDAPGNVEAVSRYLSDTLAVVSWQPVPGAVQYHVYRAPIEPIGFFLGQAAGSISIQIPGTDQTITLDAIQSGQFDSLCSGTATSPLCEAVNVVKDASSTGVANFPLPYSEIAVTTNTIFTDTPPTDRGSLYYIRAEDSSGNLSNESNFVLAPSKAMPGAPPTITVDISPAPNALGWNNTPVTVTWNASSADGIISPLCPPVTVSQDTSGTLLACTAVSGSGTPGTKVVNVKIDTVAPQLTATRTQPNANGWNNTPVTVQFSCTDDRSGVLGCGPGTQIVTTEGTNQSRTAVAVDAAGNKATLTVDGINIDMTPPVVTGSRLPLANSYGWNNTAVTVNFSCSDALSGVASCGPLQQIVAAEGANQSASATAVDLAGNTATFTVGSINIDLTPPVIAWSQAPVANANGWNNTPVTVSFSATDNLSGVATVSPPVLFGQEGQGQTTTGTVTDQAGNTASIVAAVNIDMTPPIITGSRLPLANGYGWNNTAVTVNFACSDALSGIASCSPAQQIVSGEGANQSRSATAVDLAGNTASATVDSINIDLTPPVILWSQAPLANGNGWNNTSVTVSFSATDNLSGIATLSQPVLFSQEGQGQTATGTATDKAGNTSVIVATVNIDLTPPEAIVQWDATTLVPIVIGSDLLSGVPSGPITPTPSADGLSNAYLITDLAGNTLQLLLADGNGDGDDHSTDVDTDRDLLHDHEVHTHVVSLQYNGGTITTAAQNNLKFQWAFTKLGALKEFEQKLDIELPIDQDVSAKYDFKNALTNILFHQDGATDVQSTQPGVFMLKMVTLKGNLSVQFK